MQLTNYNQTDGYNCKQNYVFEPRNICFIMLISLLWILMKAFLALRVC